MELQVSSLKKSFGEKEVLKGINFSVESGKALGILGRNGAGKTTAIRIVMNIYPSNGGHVLLNGKPIDYDKVKIGYLPEERGLYPKKTVVQQLIYLANLRGMKTQDAKVAAKNMLESLEITEYTNKRLDTLSKGNQQKVQLAAALICDPDIVVLDEPFSGLDPVNAMILKNVVRSLIENGKIVLFSSHQMNYVEEFCKDIAILNNGEIVLSGSIKDIKRGYKRNKIIVNSKDAKLIENFCKESLNNIVSNTKLLNETLEIEIKNENMKNDLVLALSQKKFDIDGINVFEPSLNDIFVEYTEGRI